jgi:NadR type nicotinamide-nucleotide adenylyltransferase
VSQLKKVVAIGPESTGKSTLCERLAVHFGVQYCPEYARAYLANNPKYSYEDLLTIAKGQLSLEDERVNSPGSGLLFIDTDMYVMKVWCEFVFQRCHRFILNELATRRYDLYLLCNIDLPWQPDWLREYPDYLTRKTLYKMYRDLMVNQDSPWVEISGDTEQREKTAIEAVSALQNKP